MESSIYISMALLFQIPSKLMLKSKEERGFGSSDWSFRYFPHPFFRKCLVCLRINQPLQEKAIYQQSTWEMDNSGGDLCYILAGGPFIVKRIPYECPLKTC